MKPKEARTDDEWPSAESLRHSEWKSLVVPAEYPLEEGEEQGGETKIETSSHGRWLSRQPPVYTSLGKEYSEVPAELADTVVDPNSMEELID